MQACLDEHTGRCLIAPWKWRPGPQQSYPHGALGKRLTLKNNKELILKLLEIEEDDAIVEVFTHLKALYDEQWGDAEATAPPDEPGVVAEDESVPTVDSVEETDSTDVAVEAPAEAVPAG